MSTQVDTRELADQATEQILHASFTNAATIVKAPPGAGKSTICTLTVDLHLRHNHRVAIATPTRAQGHDLTHSLIERLGPNLVHWFGKNPPAGVEATPTFAALPDTSHVAVATAARWAFVNDIDEKYDLLIIDEAFQLTDADFARIAGLAHRIVLMGDPAQIAPVVTVDAREWEGESRSPVGSAPRTLLARHPDTPVIELPATWRFGPETAALVSAAFYEWSWGSNRADGDFIPPTKGPLQPTRPKQEIYSVTLPAASQTHRADPDMAAALAALAEQVLSEGRIADKHGTQRAVRDVFIIAAHIDQVTAARAAAAHLSAVTVDTAERLQGRQADVVLVWHPASGLAKVGEFQRDAGRMCVMLSRHKWAVAVLYREGALDAPITVASRTLAPGINTIADQIKSRDAVGAVLRARAVPFSTA